MSHGHGSRALTVLLSVLSILGGCAHKPVRVACDEKLQPINQPAPVSHVGGASPTSSVASSVEVEKSP